ncbi:MFS transporter [Companilactobacillus kimchiensis]|uniref:Major facilitator superfamily (MFS) profile domain-containing protein n=1 Tax=Companilactobacillus kimchiensis TaxID=993692 RepID=A0A0R2LDX8_9LACO|nr:MFS transporter [Companilactobacillus kimchiensis]KRO00078.1 hypothetical protein IV57_GL002094 [Companilactobacillus kimchiensis]
MMKTSKLKEKFEKLPLSSKKLSEYLLVVGSATTIYLFIGLRGILYEPFRAQLGATNTQLGLLMSIMGFVQIFGYLVFGWIQERMNVRKLLTFDMICYGIIGLVIAVSSNPPFPLLIVYFVLFGIFGEALYWPTIQKSVKHIGGKKSQATAFGVMESLRGVGGLIVNSIDVILFSAVSASLGMILGIKAAMIFNSAITILFALLVWFKLPHDFMDDAKMESSNKEKNEDKTDKISFNAVIQAFKLPVVWLTGLGSACAYITYVGVSTYFVPYLQNSFAISAALVAVFGIVNGTAVNVASSSISGIVSDKLFKNSASWMSICYALMTVFLGITMFIPKEKSLVVVAMIFLLLTTLSCFLIRAVYYAPLGQYGIPDDISSTAMSIASFFGYSPSFFAYPIFGRILDSYSTNVAYKKIFTILIVFSILGIILNLINSRLIKKGYKAPVTD